MEQIRKLVAIMFTDIVGYSRLMGANEQKALEMLNKNRDLHKQVIDKFNGYWIKEIGDGTLASFNTALDAVHAAMKIQEDCNESKYYRLKIGIHLGEVIFENKDVFGDGVNIASRIADHSIGGSIFISMAVRDQIKNNPELKTIPLGKFRLKNIKESIELFGIKNPGIVLPPRNILGVKSLRLAVLIALLIAILLIWQMARKNTSIIMSGIPSFCRIDSISEEKLIDSKGLMLLFLYDPFKNRLLEIRPNIISTGSPALVFKYDGKGRLIEMLGDLKNGAFLFRHRYGYTDNQISTDTNYLNFSTYPVRISYLTYDYLNRIIMDSIVNVDALYEKIKGSGGKIASAPENKEWGLREMLVEDPDGHTIRFGHNIHEWHGKREARLPSTIKIIKRNPTPQEHLALISAVGWSSSVTDAMEEKIVAAPVFSVVAEDTLSGKTIGCALLLGDDASFYYVKDVMVHPQFQHKLVGTSMMQEISDWLDVHGADKALVGLYTGHGLSAFYQKFGFTPAFGMNRKVLRHEKKG